MHLKFVKTKRGRDALIIDVHRYNLHTTNKTRSTIWRCVRSECTASVTLANDKKRILRNNSKHTCIPPDRCINKVCEIIDKCKQEVCQELIPVQQIFERNFQNFNCTEHDPLFESHKSTLYRQRKKFLETDLKFGGLTEVTVPKVLGDNFLLIDDGDADKILIFVTKYARKRITKKKHAYFGDGTFRCVPSPFYQLYSLHIDYGSNEKATNIRPVVFALLPDKSQQTYMRFFKLLKEILNIDVKTFKADYELGALNAVRAVFPQAIITGCFHHYNDAIWRKSKQLHVNESKSGRRLTRLCALLPLLPANLIHETWHSLMQDLDENEDFSEFLNYVTNQWINKLTCNVISVAFERHRTTNALEGWHRRVNGIFPRKANFHLFLSKLRSEANYADKKAKRSLFHGPPKNRKKCDIVFDKKYKKLLLKLDKNELDPKSLLYKILYLKLVT